MKSTHKDIESAYSKIGHAKTMYSKLFEGCLDYIFFSSGSLQCTSALQLPTEDEIRFAGGGPTLPNRNYPSDHLRLEASFKFTGVSN